MTSFWCLYCLFLTYPTLLLIVFDNNPANSYLVKLRAETQERSVKYVQDVAIVFTSFFFIVNDVVLVNDVVFVNDVVLVNVSDIVLVNGNILVFLLLTLNTFHTFFIQLLLTYKSQVGWIAIILCIYSHKCLTISFLLKVYLK